MTLFGLPATNYRIAHAITRKTRRRVGFDTCEADGGRRREIARAMECRPISARQRQVLPRTKHPKIDAHQGLDQSIGRIFYVA
jgi:hypothetical protein